MTPICFYGARAEWNNAHRAFSEREYQAQAHGFVRGALRTQEARRQNAFKPTPLEFVGSGTNTANRDALSTQARECAGPNVESQPCGRETPEDPSASPVQVQQARQSGALDASEHEFSFGCSRRPVTPRTLSTLSTPFDPFRPSALFAAAACACTVIE